MKKDYHLPQKDMLSTVATEVVGVGPRVNFQMCFKESPE